MSLFTDAHVTAVNHCLSNSIPFAIIRSGKDADICVYTLDCVDTDNAMWAIPWLGEVKTAGSVMARCNSIDELYEVAHPADFPQLSVQSSTDKADYLTGVDNVIAALRQRGGKTVISRIISGIKPHISWGEVAARLFDRFPAHCCYIFSHPATGTWLGATPELLLRFDSESLDFDTMALAGTKHPGDKWDNKNIEEQQMVADFIVDTLRHLSSRINVGLTETLLSGNIEHLCTPISGKIRPGVKFRDIVSELSPTPALAGFPRSNALDEIAHTEKHSRRMYGGVLVLRQGPRTTGFVTLRCMQISGNHYSIYTGSGITAKSVAEAEWRETLDKATPLLETVDYFNPISH